MEIESVTHMCRPGGKERGYDIIGGELKWGRIGNRKFEFIIGNKYKVSRECDRKTRHKGAVGIYEGFRRKEDVCQVMLKCSDKRFAVDAADLIPYEGDIKEEHRKLVSPVKKMHLSVNGRCVCNCDTGATVNPAKLLRIEEFLNIPENSRCKNCNSIVKKQKLSMPAK
jgi:hypothetical protein